MPGSGSRACCRLLFVALLAGAGLVAVPLPAAAQDAIDAQVAARLAETKAVYGAVPPPRRCEGGSDDEIVVCAPGDSDRYRVPSTTQSNPGSREGLRTGVPSAPQLDRGSCRGQPNCIIGGWTPPKVYVIDLKAIPEAPEGSDAEAVANGTKSDR